MSRLTAELLADLSRQYSYEGIIDRKPTLFHVMRRAFHPRFAPVVLCRLAHAYQRAGLGPLAKLASLTNFVTFGIEISLKTEIGPGLFLPHTVGTVIGAHSIGKNATIFQGVTFGAKQIDFSHGEGDRPTIGDNVIVGAGAKVIGGVQVGDNVVIGANAVVVESVPNSVVVAGIPAKVINSKANESS